MESSRLSRALKLLNLLQSGHGATAEYLAHSLNCSKRTIFRDIKLLNDNDIRVWYDEREGGYTSEHQLWAMAASMDDEEFVGLLAAALLSPLTRIRPFLGVVDQAVAKMMGRGSIDTRNRVNRLIRAIIPPQNQLELTAAEHEVFDMLTRAIVNRHALRLKFTDGDDGPQRSTKFFPYQLAAHEGRWTVIGRSTRHRCVTRIRVIDIQEAVSTQDEYEIPLEYLQEGLTGNAFSFSSPSRASLGAIPSPLEADEFEDDDD